MKKQDYYLECNEHNVPEEDFTAAFCSRCLRRDCVRSTAIGNKFDERVQNWEDRFFTGVPRMDMQDPRFVQIRAKKFQDIDVGPAPNIRGPSAWLDPRELDASPKTVQDQVAAPQSPPPVEDEEGPPTDPEPGPLQEPPAPQTPNNPPPVGNTPFQHGQMLQGHAPAASSPKPPQADPWAAPQSAGTASGKVVKPGAKIKLGG